jgi:sortase (surface protein transpeptidase)
MSASMTRRPAWGVVLCLTLAMVGCAQTAAAERPSRELGRVTTPASVDVVPEVRSFEAARDYQSVAPPVQVDIPAISVTSPIDQLARNPDGTIQVPAWHRAGWFAEGPKPGQAGPAVILGHVDSRHGPDVFYRLHELVPGDQIVITRADGSQLHFTIDRVEHWPKDSFPTESVYAPSLEPGLRLVTCGGEFDRSTGHYVDNVVVFASPTEH